MRRHAVLILVAAALAACAQAKDPGATDAEIKIDGAPRPDAPPVPDAPPAPDAPPHIDAPPGTPDAPPPPPDASSAADPDTCAMPEDLTAAASTPAGATVTGDTTGYANDTQPASSCTGYTPDGPDAIYTISATAGQTITAMVTPGLWDASIFIASNCQLDAACLAGADDSPFPGDYEIVQLVAPSTGVYFVVVESWDPGDYGTYQLDVTLN
jgi:hypothetical protein